MKIAYISPGSGDSFYCENCIRDRAFVKALSARGHRATLLPMYLPVFSPGEMNGNNSPVFYGAINIYLKQLFPRYGRFPGWIKRVLDSGPFLKIAARQAGSTRASGLNQLTISMLKGKKGNQAEELDIMIKWLKEHEKPDILHLSNALLSGLAGRIKKELDIPVVCSLQDEDTWIDEMEDNFAREAWDIINKNAEFIDLFLPVSQYYKSYMEEKIPAGQSKMAVVYNGVDPGHFVHSTLPFHPPVIGYMSRMAKINGLGELSEAFINLKKRKGMEAVELHITGGHTHDDKSFLKELGEKWQKAGVAHSVKVFHHFDESNRKEFLKQITILSVPIHGGSAFGLFLLEAFASGVPVIQPGQGAFKELIHLSGGGATYDPGSNSGLEKSLFKLLSDPRFTMKLGEAGRKSVTGTFNIGSMVDHMVAHYTKLGQ